MGIYLQVTKENASPIRPLSLITYTLLEISLHNITQHSAQVTTKLQPAGGEGAPGTQCKAAPEASAELYKGLTKWMTTGCLKRQRKVEVWGSNKKKKQEKKTQKQSQDPANVSGCMSNKEAGAAAEEEATHSCKWPEDNPLT